MLSRRSFRLAQNQRDTRQSTWITKDIVSAYEELNRIGYAHSIEVWRENKLVGGLYLVSIGKMVLEKVCFFGRQMFPKLLWWLLQNGYKNMAGNY